MRMDPEGPRGKAKMKALDKLIDMLDYSNTKMKDQGDTEKDLEKLEDSIEETDGGDGFQDPEGEMEDEQQLIRDGEDPPEDVDESADELSSYKTIDMRRRANPSTGEMDSLKKAAHDMPDGPRTGKKQRR